MGTKRVIVRGRVQNVGFRDWAVREATRLRLCGWVRNRRDGGVELLLDGDADGVEEMLRACRRGPRDAQVEVVEDDVGEPPDHEGFLRLPTG